MSADNRTPHTDALATLGTIHEHKEYRDAIHLAVEQVVAGEDLPVGQEITYQNGFAYAIRQGEEAIGIVDPFLKRVVREGEKFWLVVKPRLITSLRHVWSHPAFPDEASVTYLKEQQEDAPAELKAKSSEEIAYAWISTYAESLGTDGESGEGVTPEELIEYGRDFYRSNANGGWGDYLCKGGLLEGESVPDEFWDNLEILSGTKYLEEHRGSFFTCSC